VLGLFQAIVMLQVNRKAWLIVIVGVFAATVASVPLLFPSLLYGKPLWTLIMGTMIQAFGTCLLFLYFMAHPRENIVPKPDDLKKPNTNSNVTLAATPFIFLWMGVYYLHVVMQFTLTELWDFMVYYSPDALYYGLDLGKRGAWYESVIVFGPIGIIIARAQNWLIKKHSNRTIPGWYLFTIVGWIFAGMVWWRFQYAYSRTELESILMFGGYLTIPALFQALPMNRVFKGGWMWAVIGVLAGLLAVFIRGRGWLNLSNFYGTTFAGLALSFATVLVFLRLQSQSREARPAIEGLEGS
jgi:hypothetical protein